MSSYVIDVGDGSPGHNPSCLGGPFLCPHVRLADYSSADHCTHHEPSGNIITHQNNASTTNHHEPSANITHQNNAPTTNAPTTNHQPPKPKQPF